jgi:hypothetical protein
MLHEGSASNPTAKTDVHDELEHHYSEMTDNADRFRRLEMMQVIGSPCD